MLVSVMDMFVPVPVSGSLPVMDQPVQTYCVAPFPTGEFVTEHVDADFLVGFVEGADGRFNALHRAGITEHIPVAQVVHNHFAPARRVGNPLTPVAAEHVFAHVIQYLDTLHRRVNAECRL